MFTGHQIRPVNAPASMHKGTEGKRLIVMGAGVSSGLREEDAGDAVEVVAAVSLRRTRLLDD
jgi:hypothetical protein